MSDLFSDIFKENLLTEKISEEEIHLPSPEDLTHKIILKGRIGRCQDYDEEDEPFPENLITPNVAEELSNKFVYCQSRPEITKSSIQSKQMTYQRMSSTTDRQMLKEFDKFDKDELIKYHEKVLSRIYPKLSNINSGNFNPIPHWNIGAQIAALNIQTPDRYLRINNAMF